MPNTPIIPIDPINSTDAPATLGEKILKRYPTHIPIILESRSDFTFPKSKLLINKNATVIELFTHILKMMPKVSTDSISIMINGQLGIPCKKLSTYFESNRNDKTGCLHVQVYKQNTFG